MKTVTMFAVVCALMSLTRAAALPEAEAKQDLTVKSHLVKRATSCSRGWSKFNGRCFHYYPTAKTWAQAEKICQSLNANLASVHNIQEYHKIQRMIQSKTHEYTEAWLGGSDAQADGTWLWSDGSQFTSVNWCAGEPNNHRKGQHCLQMNYGGDKCWDDHFCNILRPFVCAMKM